MLFFILFINLEPSDAPDMRGTEDYLSFDPTGKSVESLETEGGLNLEAEESYFLSKEAV